jgi:hypothetical protein
MFHEVLKKLKSIILNVSWICQKIDHNYLNVSWSCQKSDLNYLMFHEVAKKLILII